MSEDKNVLRNRFPREQGRQAGSVTILPYLFLVTGTCHARYPITRIAV